MLNLAIGDFVITKKPHPCGNSQWLIIRTGADIKLKCIKCNRIIMLDRCECERRIKKLIKVNEVAIDEQKN